jgi:hypothetical protein
MRFKVPQDVQREDTIIGPITFKQLVIMIIGGGITYSMYLILFPIYKIFVWLPIVVILGLLTLSFAFLKVFNMNFTVFLLYLIEFLSKPKVRFFHRNNLTYKPKFSEKPVLIKSEDDKQKVEQKKISQDNIDDISELLDK